ncbi:MAG: HutD family protein [Rhizobiaceae bacterium]|nr:MAG: HutD family protein [Rhizobiaceae bacterium]
MTSRILAPDRYRHMPWKNGGGETVEIAIDPPCADLDSFGWRISMATVGSDGPFSAFPGIERTLSILSGAGISLAVGNDDPVRLDTGSEPFTFPADMTAAAHLIDGPVTDFNVMTRRSDWRHTVRRVRMDAGTVLSTDQPSAAHTIVFCRSGVFEAGDGTTAASLTANATLWVECGADPWILRSAETGTVFVVEIEATGA